jgi:hypothetical protein
MQSLSRGSLSRPKLFSGKKVSHRHRERILWDGARVCTECMLQWSCCSLVHLSSTSTTITQNDMAKLRGIKKAMTPGLWLYRRRRRRHSPRSCDRRMYGWMRRLGCESSTHKTQGRAGGVCSNNWSNLAPLLTAGKSPALPNWSPLQQRAITKFKEFLSQKLMSLDTFYCNYCAAYNLIISFRISRLCILVFMGGWVRYENIIKGREKCNRSCAKLYFLAPVVNLQNVQIPLLWEFCWTQILLQ